MGKKKSTSTSSNTPWSEAQPYLLGAADNLNGAYSQNAGTIQNSADQISGLLPSIIAKYQGGNAGVNAAQGYNTDVLNGQYLDAGNPYLQSMIDQSVNDTTNATQAALGLRGLTGGSAYADIISKNAANTALGMRYSDYASERSRMANAASQAGSLAAAEEIPMASALSAAGASTMPLQAASGYAGGVGGLLSGYGTQSTTQPGGWGNALLSAGTSLGSAYLMSDARLKTDVRRVGRTDEGASIYTYRYGGEGPYHMGVMAQEIEQTQPAALGPVVNGYKSVNYAEVR